MMMRRDEAIERLRRQIPAKEDLMLTLTRWAEINSGSSNLEGLGRMSAVLADAFGPLADRCETISSEAYPDLCGELVQTGDALRLRKRPQAPVQILLSGHMDTVYGPESEFQHCRLLSGGVLNGPGVADMKGGLLVMLEALRAFEQWPGRDTVGWEVLITADEEIGSHSGEHLLREAAATHHVGIVFESSLPGDRFVLRRRGNGTFRFMARGRSAHTGRDFEAGRNAIVGLSALIGRLHAINGTIEGANLNVGRIEGGGPLNMVPDRAYALVNARVSTQGSIEAVLQAMATAVAQCPVEDGVELDWSGGFTRPPREDSPELQRLCGLLGECAADMGLKAEFADSGGSSEANNLSAYGLPCLDGLGVRGGKIHTPEEFMIIDSLPERIELCLRLLIRLAEGGLHA